MTFIANPTINRWDGALASAPRQLVRQYHALLARNPVARDDAFRLRYDSYLDQNFIEPHRSRRFRDRYDDLDNCRTIVVYDGNHVVGSVRLCLVGRPGLVSPALHAFPQAADDLLGNLPPGSFGAEITRLVRSPAAAHDQSLVFLLYRLANYVGFVEQVSIMMAAVRRNHAPFYRRLGFTTCSEPAPYPGLSCPMQLMSCLRPVYESRFSQFPQLDPFASGAERLDGLYRGDAVPISSAGAPL